MLRFNLTDIYFSHRALAGNSWLSTRIGKSGVIASSTLDDLAVKPSYSWLRSLNSPTGLREILKRFSSSLPPLFASGRFATFLFPARV